jgi:hypothetical protein
VPDRGNVVKKEVGERLPDAKERHNSSGDKSEPFDKSFVCGLSRKVIEECFKYENGEIRDQEELHTRGDVKVEGDPVALDSRP